MTHPTLPTALVIGPMKAGTTWVHDYLAWRGDICLPQGTKEVFFFDRYFDRGVAWYGKYFREYDPQTHKAVIEVAPSLFHCADAPERVAATLGPVPLIVTTREPVSRAWSHYMHLRRKGFTKADLAEALAAYPEIVEASCYEDQIARWRAAMPEAPVTVLALDALIADPSRYAAQICAALALPERDPSDEIGKSYEGSVPPSFLLARLGRQTAEGLASMGGHGIVNLAKRMGLRRLFFGADGGKRPKISDSERALLEARLRHPDRP